MSLNEIFANIRATSSKLDKRRILAEQVDNTFLRDFLKAVYDPRIQYGIKKMPKKSDSIVSPREFCEEDLSDLMNLANGDVTGKAAKEMLAGKLAAFNDAGKELLGYLIARDVNAGMAENTVLSVWPDLFYIPPYQRCAGMTPELKERFGQMPFFYVQTKSDGQFCYAIKRRTPEGTQVQAMSRAGSLYPVWLAASITEGMPEGFVTMGELLVVRDGTVMSRKDGNGVLNSVLSGDGSKFLQTDSVRFVAWDMVTEEEFDAGASTRTYQSRWEDLCQITSLDRIPTWVVRTVKEANKIQREHTSRGEEGTVWKNPNMGWRDCSSGDKDMMKAKVVFEAEYIITGAYEGEGKAKGKLGGFNMATSDNLIQFSVGSGFNDEQRLNFWQRIQENPQAFNGTLATCEGNDIVTSKSKPGIESVFLPIFIELRLDKKEADSKARVWEQFKAAKEAKE